MFIVYLDSPCFCTEEYNLTLDVPVEAYCKDWSALEEDPGLVFCYLHGGLSASRCPGAQRSEHGEFYWTNDPAICNAAKKRKSEKAHIKFSFMCMSNAPCRDRKGIG